MLGSREFQYRRFHLGLFQQQLFHHHPFHQQPFQQQLFHHHPFHQKAFHPITLPPPIPSM